MRPEPKNWKSMRNAVYKRDDGICQVCRTRVDPDAFECGHLIDRVANGLDTLPNLVVMCFICNRSKPIHRTREEYERWSSLGGPLKIVAVLMLAEQLKGIANARRE